MNSSDDVQRLWQQDDSRMEDPAMWMRLIQEKRTGFDELVRVENQAWYLVALSIGPLVTGRRGRRGIRGCMWGTG
jgi:hypothetical protein